MIATLVALGLVAPPRTHAAVRAGDVKLSVRETGVYRVTGADLAVAGVPLSEMAVDRISLTCQGKPAACLVTGVADGRLSETSAIVFYGEALDTRYTDTNVYWLTWDGDAGPTIGKPGPAAAAGEPVREATVHERFEQNVEMGKFLFAPEEDLFDHWVWAISAPDKPCELKVRLRHSPVPGTRVRFRVAVRGRTDLPVEPDHHTIITVNGEVLEDALWDGQAQHIAEGELPLEGPDPVEASVQVTCPADTEAGDMDSVALNFIEAEYQVHPVVPTAQELVRLEVLPQGTGLMLDGARDDLELALDVTDPRSPIILPVADPGGGSIAVQIPRRPPGPRSVHLVAKDASYDPVIQRAQEQTDLRALPPADYLAVTDPSLEASLARLTEHRQQDGLTVAVVRVGDIYDQYSWGIMTPEAIRDFVADWYGRAPEDEKPRFLLLAGDASYDYRDFLETGVRNFVPGMLVRIPPGLETAVDSYFGIVADDTVVEALAVGRIPARTTEELDRYIEKVMRYETQMLAEEAEWRSRVLLIADHDQRSLELARYEDGTASLARAMREKGLATGEIYVRSYLTPATQTAEQRRSAVREQMTAAMVEALRQGNAVVTYRGHGGEWGWSRDQALLIGDVLKPTASEGYAIVLDTSCFTAWFDKPMAEPPWTLAEAMVLSDFPAVACVAPARLGGDPIDETILGELCADPSIRLGEALVRGREKLLYGETSEWAVCHSYCLLGDPALKPGLRVPDAAPGPN